MSALRLRWHRCAGLCWLNQHDMPMFVGNRRWWKWPQRLINWIPGLAR